MNISCIITDDEPIARKGLRGYVERTGFLDLKAECEDGIELNNLLKASPVDLLFLDIEMPGINGIDLLRSLTNSPKVIFTTAYERYAMDGFELEVLDYLLKPISFERFLKSANKAFDYFNAKASLQTYLFVKTDRSLEKVIISEILFIEAMENYIRIHTAEKKLLVHSTMKAFHDKLPASKFIQPHKSFLVNIDQVNAVMGNLIIIGSQEIPISKYKKEDILRAIS